MKVMYEDDIPTDTEELGTDQYDSEDLSNVFSGPTAEGDSVRIWGLLPKYMENTRSSHDMYGKPCIPHFPLYLPVLLSASYL